MSKYMIGMNQIYIVVEYNGKWENVDGRFWRWFGAGISKGFVVDRSIKFLELEETIYNKTSIDRSMYAIEITHKPVGDIFGDTTSPTLICNDSDIIDLMFYYNEKRGMTLHVTKIEKCDKGKAICVRGDDDMNSNGVGNYEHPLQICATSTPINEGITGFNPTPITGSNPTPKETVLGEVANEDYGVDNAGDDVSEGGDDSRKEDDGVPEEDDRRWQQAESEDTRFVPLISSNSGRNDGSDLMVGQHFESKEELNTKLNLVAIEGKFEMKNRFKSAASLGVFKAAAEAYYLEEFGKHFSDMRQLYPKVAQYLEKDVKFQKWSRAHFKGNRYEVMTTNIVETLNNMMLKAREYPVTAMIDFVLFTMGQWFFTRRRESVLVTTPITPKREEILRRRFDEAGSLTPYQLNENEYTVIGGDCNACVNLTTRSCTCRVFDIDKIPCIHAIAAAGLYRPQHTGAYVYSLCSEYYCSDYWMLAYAETIYPVPPKSQWHNIPEEVRAIKVAAPNVEMFRGRPRLIRFPSQGECIVKKYKCASCGQKGHNSKKCPNLANPSDVSSNT
ncbi:hypothetical protein TIFTF001_046961 [Ficus carica]|uniref:CCHC-type domain-containing protein n=1 Tax=Ficus carica TaxID=3494 RepID=A0AA87YUY8_FICCA|nr:hypothetical protein TIFTF001_046961 [Ficus carica]